MSKTAQTYAFQLSFFQPYQRAASIWAQMATKPVKNPIKDACASQKPPIKHLYSTPDPFTHFAPGQIAWPPHGPSWHEFGYSCRSCGKCGRRSTWGSCSNLLPHPCPKSLAKGLLKVWLPPLLNALASWRLNLLLFLLGLFRRAGNRVGFLFCRSWKCSRCSCCCCTCSCCCRTCMLHR